MCGTRVCIVSLLGFCLAVLLSAAAAAPTDPHPYGLVELGAKGVKAYTFDLQRVETQASCNQDSETYYRCLDPQVVDTINADAIEPSAIAEAVAAVVKLRDRLIAERGVLPEHVMYVGSSGLSAAPHREELAEAVRRAIGPGHDFVFVLPDQEARYAYEGLMGMLPRALRETADTHAVVLDFGSGNIKGSYGEGGNLYTFSFSWGTKKATDEINAQRRDTPFLDYLPLWIDQVFRPAVRAELDHRPGALNRDRVYLQGGAVWAMVNLSDPSNRDNIAPITAPELNAFVERTQRPDALQHMCTDNLDRGINDQIVNICKTFTLNNLQVAARMLQTVATELGVAQKRLFFPRNALLAWPIGYARHHIGPISSPPCAPTPGVTSCVSPVIDSALRLHGSNTIGAELAPALLKGWVESHHGTLAPWQSPAPDESRAVVSADAAALMPLQVEVFAHNSGTGIPDLLAHKADIANLSRPLNRGEETSLETQGVADPHGRAVEAVIALDGVAVFVHPSLNLPALKPDDMAGLFTGVITNWKQLNGPDLPVTVFRRPFGSGTLDTFCDRVLRATCSQVADEPGQIQMCRSSDPTSCKRVVGIEVEDSRVLSDKVSHTSGSVGFGGLAYIENNNGLRVNECGLGYEPVQFYVKTGEYPFARKLFSYRLPDSRNTWVEPFLAYAKSDEAGPVIEHAGFVNHIIEIGDQSVRDFRRRMASTESANSPTRGNGENAEIRHMVTLTGEATRLSVTFRFAFGKSDIDSTAEDDLKRLVAFMQLPEQRGHKLHVVGFASAPGTDDANYQLARARAAQVATWLRNTGVINIGEVFGVGKNLYVACNEPGDPATSRSRLNQRVEIWME
jgi:phosphate transport system substrate-binding protein